MKIQSVLLLMCMCFFIACSQRSNEQGKQENDSIDNKNMKTPTTNNGTLSASEEDFHAFLNKFSAEESFQLKRIKFPIKVIVPNTEHEGMAPMEDTIGKYDWETLDLTYDSTYATRQFDRYYQTVRFANDTAVVEVRGINNGIYADYYFKKIDKKWFLVTLNEASF